MSDVNNPVSLDKQDLINAARKLWGKETAKTKNEWRFGSHGSKSIRLDDLVWFDHEEDKGGGIVELCRRAGINSSWREPTAATTREPQDDWRPNLDPPAEAPINLLTCDHLFTYRCAAGNATHYVKRFERPRKFLPLTWGALNGTEGWHLKAPRPPLPLYKLEDLHELNPSLVLLVEGEKSADAANAKIAAEQLPWLAMSWYGGAGRAKDADLEPLAGRQVLIWPDADKAGLRARDTLLEMLDGAAALNTENLGEGFDAADLKTEDSIEKFVRTRSAIFDEAPQPARPRPQPLPETKPSGFTGPEPAVITGWDDIPPPEPQWIVPGIIPVRQVTLFSGEGAAGKSTIALHLAAATVLGLGWLVSTPEQGPAFFIDAEDDLDIIHWRLEAIRKLYQTTFAELHQRGLHIWSLAGKDALFTSADRNRGSINPTNLYKFFLEKAKEIKPKIIVIASSANVFSGNENDRPQVTFFVNMLKTIAIAAMGAVVLISHPSIQGINSGTGLSGSTQWHNAVRARMVLHGCDDDKNLRELEFQKNQYGPLEKKTVLEYSTEARMFLVKPGMGHLEIAAREAKAETVFLDLLAQWTAAGRHLSDRPRSPNNYAPKKFAIEQMAVEAKLKKSDFEEAMERLFSKGAIRMEDYGAPSDKTQKIVLAQVE